jgi:hypothetical protein
MKPVPSSPMRCLVAVRRAFPRIDQQTEPVGLRGIGDPHLRTVDDVVTAVLARGGLDRRDVGATRGLAHRDRRHRFAGDRRNEKLLAQLVAAPARERGRRHVGLHAERHRDRSGTARAELLRDDHLIRVIEAHAAEGLGLVDAEQPEPARLLEHVMRGERAGLLPGIDVRVDLLVDELANGAAQL